MGNIFAAGHETEIKAQFGCSWRGMEPYVEQCVNGARSPCADCAEREHRVAEPENLSETTLEAKALARKVYWYFRSIMQPR